MPRIGRGISYLSKDEVERLFSVIPEGDARDRLLFDLIYRYGLRRSEAAALRLEHLHDGRIWIERVKNGISSEYPVFPSTERLLREYLPLRDHPASPFLFTSRQSGCRPISASGIFQRFRAYAELAGIPEDRRHVHVLRHASAVHLMNSGWDASDVMSWLGHRDITSTMIYAKVTDRRRTEMFEKALLSAEIAAMGA